MQEHTEQELYNNKVMVIPFQFGNEQMVQTC